MTCRQWVHVCIQFENDQICFIGFSVGLALGLACLFFGKLPLHLIIYLILMVGATLLQGHNLLRSHHKVVEFKKQYPEVIAWLQRPDIP